MVKHKLYSIILKHERELYNLAYRFDPNQAEDLVQEAYLQIIKVLKNKGEKPWPYLKTTARRAMVKYLKGRKNEISLDKSISPYDSRTLLDILGVNDKEHIQFERIKLIAEDFVYKVKLAEHSEPKKLFLWQLFEYGLKKDDINELIDEGIICGKKLPQKPIEVARIVFSSRYYSDPSYREKIKPILQENFYKALEAHKKLLENDKKYREKTIENLMAAIEKRKEKRKADPEYREHLNKILRRNISKALKHLREKLLTDEEFQNHMLESRRKNIQKGREKKLRFYKLRRKALKKIILKEGSIGIKNTVEILMEKYPEFIKTYYPSSEGINLYNAIANDIRKIKGKISGEEKRKIFNMSKTWKKSLEKARKASSEKRLEKISPRRKLLTQFMLKKYNGLDVPVSIVISDISESELRNYYNGIKDLYHAVKKDIEWAKENL